MDNIGQELPACAACSSNRGFETKSIHNICGWDVEIPLDWKWGDWEQVRLYPVEIPIVLVRCLDCNAHSLVYPSFITSGTRLTLQALVFIALVYEKSELTWRGIVDRFCDSKERIAHSTLYRAVHSVGLLISGESAYHVAEEYLMRFQIPELSEDIWPPLKSRYEHTRQREESLRCFLQLLCLLLLASGFAVAFFRYLGQVHLFFSQISQPLPQLYSVHAEAPLANTS